ncbi:MAG: beta-lactamase family protein [Paucibacter sp.]|nr:beta-lactamase family protein [Roseateles sp.]
MNSRHLALPLTALLLALLLAACASAPQLPPEPLTRADAAVQRFIDAGQMPGGVLWIERGGNSHHRAFGTKAAGGTDRVTEDTVFDAASLTKVVVTSTLVQVMRERGLLDMDAPVSRYLPDCGNVGGMTLRHLLTHSSGLPPDLLSSDPFMQGPEPASTQMPQAGREVLIGRAVQRACAQKPEAEPGRQFRYSDLNFILLGEILTRVAGMPLQELARRELFEPLGMTRSGYLPRNRGIAAEAIAPTNKPAEPWERGAVHDPTARRMGGVAGHAGLFTTADDLARFARMLVNDGIADSGRRFLSHESIVLLETPQSPPDLAELRSMGWDVATSFSRPRGSLYPSGKSFGHTGFTGCSLWLDPGSHSFYILLANRVNMPQGTNTVPLYAELGTLAAEAAGFKPPAAP